MKNRIAFLFAFLIAVTGSTFAESDSAQEFKRLDEEHQKAITAAIEPINRRYQESLEQLLRKATQANDLDTAVRIKEVIGTLAQSAPSRNKSSDAVSSSILGEWYWGEPKNWMLFYPNGKSSMAGKQHQWEVLSDGTVIVKNPSGEKATLHFDAAFKTFTGINFNGRPLKGWRK